jgi:hypothetical protein
MPDELDDFFRCVETGDVWAFQVGVVKWDGPSTPRFDWITYRRWKTAPDEKRIQKAKAAAMAQPRFFGTCSMCHELHNAGHMHTDDFCQGCAEQKLGVVH